MTEEIQEEKQLFGLNGFILKLIACILMTLDHAALLFVNPTTENGYAVYYILRAMGKISFPIFAFLAVEGAYHTKDNVKYLFRLLAFGAGLEIFGYGVTLVSYLHDDSSYLTVAENPILGNAFIDLFLGVLTVTLLRKKNSYSFLAALPIAYALLSRYYVNNTWGFFLKTDWGVFSIVIFLFYYIARESADYFIQQKAQREQADPVAYQEAFGLRLEKGMEVLGLLMTELLFYIIWRATEGRTDYWANLVPNEFVPIGTYSVIACLFIAFYNGRRGYDSQFVKYGFYAYYPLHVVILAVFSLAFGVLKQFL